MASHNLIEKLSFLRHLFLTPRERSILFSYRFEKTFIDFEEVMRRYQVLLDQIEKDTDRKTADAVVQLVKEYDRIYVKTHTEWIRTGSYFVQDASRLGVNRCELEKISDLCFPTTGKRGLF